MIVYLSPGRVRDAALCFDCESKAEEEFVDKFMCFLDGNGNRLNIRLLNELDESDDGLDALLEGNPFLDDSADTCDHDGDLISGDIG